MRTPATLALDRARIRYTVHEFRPAPHESSWGEGAALALGVLPERVFKSLVVTADSRLAVGIVPVSGRLNLKALAASLGAKRAELADPAVAERRTGYVIGGISPFGIVSPHATVLDASALEWDTIFVSGGRRGVDLEVHPTDLVTQLDAVIASIGS